MTQLRHAPTNDELWPDSRSLTTFRKSWRSSCTVKLGQVALQLDHDPHDSTRPDLFGQSYRQLFYATFHAFLSSQTDLARQLFPITIAMADRARARLSSDLAAEHVREQVIFGSEPLLDMMELSGYALLMSELDAPGIWPDVRAVWDSIFSGDTAPALARHMSAVLSAHENLFAITTGGVGAHRAEAGPSRAHARTRHRRHHRHVGRATRARARERDRRGLRPANIPGFIQPELADLFIVEYLKQRPDMADLKIPRGAERLQDSLERYRQRMQHMRASEAGGTK